MVSGVSVQVSGKNRCRKHGLKYRMRSVKLCHLDLDLINKPIVYNIAFRQFFSNLKLID